MTTLQLRVATPVQAHDALEGLWKGVIKPHTQHGAAGVITWETESTYLRKKMRGKLHVVLGHISRGVWFTDPATGLKYRYAAEVWKHFFRREFLEPQLEEYKKRTGEIAIRRRRPSTEELSDDAYSEFLTAVEAYAIVDLGLELPDEGY